MKFTTNWHLEHNGKMFEPGETVEMTEAEGVALGAVLTPVASSRKKAEKVEGDGAEDGKTEGA